MPQQPPPSKSPPRTPPKPIGNAKPPMRPAAATAARPRPNACSTHPDANAAWRCTGCEKQLCEMCAGLKSIGPTSLTLCVHCGEVAEQLRIRREDAASYPARLPGALAYPLNSTGLFTMLAAGLVMYLLGFAGGRGMALGNAVVWSYVFSLARASAMGSTDMDVPDFVNFWDFFRPMRRGLFAVFVAWLPAIIFLIVLSNVGKPKPMDVSFVGAAPPVGLQEVTGDVAVPDENGNLTSLDRVNPNDLPPELREQYQQALANGHAKDLRKYTVMKEEPLMLRAVKNPLFWLFLLLGFALGPMSLALGVADGSYWQMLNPKLLVSAIARFPRSYVFLAASLFAIMGAQAVVWLVSAIIGRIPIPIVPNVIGEMMEMYLPLVTARVIGLYLYVHGAELGYLPPEDAYEPAAPNAVPRAVLPEKFASAPSLENRNPDDAAMAGLSGNAATWQAPSREVALPPPPEGAVEADNGYVRPKEITLDDEPMTMSPESAPRARPRPTELDPTALDNRAFDLSADEPMPESAVDPLAAALTAKEFARALALYRVASPEVAAAIDGDGLFELGRQAATEGDFPTAVRALKSAAQVDPQSPTAPKALVVMARVLGERMGDAVNATKVYQHVARAYPGTDAAKFAASKLGGTAAKS